MKVKAVFIGFLIFSIGLCQNALATHYLHLKGTSSSEVFLKELDEAFLAPLRAHQESVAFSHVAQVSRRHNIRLNLVVEALTEKGAIFLEDYIRARQNAGFKGLPVSFKRVLYFFETSVLRGGIYSSVSPDPLVQKIETQRSFAFSSLADWKKFNNYLGHSIRSKDHDEMIEFMKVLAKSPEGYTEIREKILKPSNYLRIQNFTHLVLEDHSVTEPGWEETPFIPWYYNRNCSSPIFENGPCEK